MGETQSVGSTLHGALCLTLVSSQTGKDVADVPAPHCADSRGHRRAPRKDRVARGRIEWREEGSSGARKIASVGMISPG